MTGTAPVINLYDVLQMYSLEDSTNIITFELQKCTCGGFSTIFVNRNGRSFCINCDRKAQHDGL